jgi:hypothetical protein
MDTKTAQRSEGWELTLAVYATKANAIIRQDTIRLATPRDAVTIAMKNYGRMK